MDRTRNAVERHLLHFDASKDKPGDRILTYYSGMTPHRVHAHTRSTLADARVGNPLLQKLPDSQFSHYLEVDLPSDSVMMTYLARATEVDGSPTEDFLSLAIHVPRAGRRECVARRGLLAAGVDDINPKLAWLLGDDAADGGGVHSLLRAGRIEPDALHDLIDPFETASTLLFQHPGLINLSSNNGGEIPAIILEQCIGRALRLRGRSLLNAIRDLGTDWSRRVPLLDDGQVVTDEEGTVFTIEVHERVRRFMSEPMGLALKYSQQLQELEGQTWRVQYGKTVDEHKPLKASAVATRPLLRADQTRWTLKALSRMNGVSTGSVTFQQPREGGWTIKETWSSDDTVPMDGETVAALVEGRMFARVDTTTHEGAWIGTFAAQALKDDETATFAAKHQSNRSGADFATVALSLDALRLDLEVDLKVTSKSTADALASINLFVREPGGLERKVWSARPTTKGQYGNLRVDVVNEWMRHLGAYAEFYDAAEKIITPAGWTSRMPLDIAPDFDKHATKKYIDVLAPVDNVFGIPLGPMTTTLDIPVPAAAASVKLYWGGLGTGEFDDTVCACGITCTAVLELALPVVMLINGSSQSNSGFVSNLMKDPKVRYGIYALGAALIGAGSGSYIGLSQNPGKAAGTVAVKLLPALAKFGLKKLSIYLAEKAAEGVAKRSIPLIGLAFLAFDTAVTLLQLGQTIAAVVQSPFYYTTKLTRTFDLHGRVLPDPAFNKFPDHHDRMVVHVLYDAGNALPIQEQRPPAETVSRPLPFEFLNIAAGGRIKVIVIFYAANGWQSALGATSWIDAKGANGSGTLDLDVTVKNALIPLSKDSAYQHRQALAYEGGKHRWKQGPAPTTTITTVSPDAGHRLLSLGGITVAQRPAMLAYSWQATGLNLARDRPGARSDEAMFAMQNVSLLEDPEAGCAVTPVGFTLPCGIAYDIGSSEDGSGANYYLDPSLGEFDPDENLAGGYHIRRIALSLGAKPRFEPGSSQSWGRFPRAVDGFLVHPQGYAVAVSADTSKLYILQLPRQAGENTRATMASMYSGEGQRVGLMKLPRAVAVALDGRLLVLEEGNRRIQCFDISGNPVPYFKQAGSGEKSAILSLRATSAQSTRYLDLSVEAKGYVFVLACDENGSIPEHYRVDIYEPDGSFLVSTPRVTAARIAVDLARSLYTLNWETWIGAEGRTEPSVSMWLPPPPKMRAGKGKK